MRRIGNHLTLHFFGNADADLEARARAALAHVRTEPPFEVTFDGLGFFPERGSPRVLMARDCRGVAGNTAPHQHSPSATNGGDYA